MARGQHCHLVEQLISAKKKKKKTMQNVKNFKTMHLKRVHFHDYIS